MSSHSTGPSLRAAMYGEQNFGATELFSGHFINFGYWPSLTPGQPLTIDERTASQAELYRTVLRQAKLTPQDSLLEVGCGFGAGSALALQEFGPRLITAMDISDDQLARALRANATTMASHPDRLAFRIGSALAMPYPDNSFDKCISVEAAQHFDDLAAFAREAHRVLTPGSTLVLATFFTCHDGAATQLRPLIETIDTGIDVPIPITLFEQHLRAAGFVTLHTESIGKFVWPGYDAWMSQTDAYRDSWGRNWIKAYKSGWIDYYLVTASKTDAAAPHGQPVPQGGADGGA